MAYKPKLWVEAFYSDNTAILGNGDGQGSITAIDYRKSRYYRHITGSSQPGWPRWQRPAYWKIVTEQGQPLETIVNPYFNPAS